MDGTTTAGCKGLPYLRDTYFPAMADQVIAAFDPHRSVLDAVEQPAANAA
jgi:hypothetical protein